MNIIDIIICHPFGAILKFIYNIFNSYGIAIIIFAFLAKAVLLPLTIKSKRSTLEMQKIQPKMKELQKRYADDKEKYAQEVAELYKSEGISPGASCLSTFITLPIITGLYYVVVRPLSFFMGLSFDEILMIAERLGLEYTTEAQIKANEILIASTMSDKMDLLDGISDKISSINFNFFGMDLSQTPSLASLLVIFPILSGISAFILNRTTLKMQAKMSGTDNNPMQNNMMFALMPLMSAWFGFMFPAGVVLYWITSNIIACVQDIIITNVLLKENKSKEELRQKENIIRQKNKRLMQQKFKESKKNIADGKNNS